MIIEEILEEAKRRYPAGTKVKCLRGRSEKNDNETGIISEGLKRRYDSSIWADGSRYNLCIYDNGKWAEIVKEEIPYSKKENSLYDLGNKPFLTEIKMDYDPEFLGLPISGEEFMSHLKTESDYDYVNPDHYKKWMHEVWEMEIAIWGKEAFILHAEMAAFEYRMRAGDKPDQPIEREIEKAQWWVNKANELRKK